MRGEVERVDDAGLVERAAAGDDAAFAELVRRHRGEVFRLALRMVSDRELAADVTQEAMVRAWRALPRFRGEAAFSTWLHRITVNTAWTQRRKALRHASEPLEHAEARASLGSASQLERVGETLDMRARLEAALGKLPVGMRAVVVLKDVYGWSHAEIARSLGITVTAAKVRLHRGRLRLQAELDGHR